MDAGRWAGADVLAGGRFAALLDVDLRVSSQRELLITALLLMLAFGVGATALIVSVQFAHQLYRSSSPRRPTSARWRWRCCSRTCSICVTRG